MNETMKKEIAVLVQQGWEADTTARGLERLEEFPHYDAAVQYLVRVGEEAENAGAMPTIRIDNGTDVSVRIGRPPSPGLTAAEIELAKSLSFGSPK